VPRGEQEHGAGECKQTERESDTILKVTVRGTQGAVVREESAAVCPVGLAASAGVHGDVHVIHVIEFFVLVGIKLDGD
jgi:hypothetical protein